MKAFTNARKQTLRLFTDPWQALTHIRDEWRPKSVDVLIGYIGRGASEALDILGVRARIVLGLAEDASALSTSQLAELNLLCKRHALKRRAGLHAKLYVFDDRVVAIGSANFTRAFEKLDEILLVTDAPDVVSDACELFLARWKSARALNIADIREARIDSSEGDGLRGIGVLATRRVSGFSIQPSGRSKNGSGPGIQRPRGVRLCAYFPKWIEQLEKNRSVLWSTSPKTRIGDLQLFCITKTGEGLENYQGDARVDAAHSLWRATSRPRKTNSDWEIQADFERVNRFRVPIPKEALIQSNLIKYRRWPQGYTGKILRGEALDRFISIASEYNPAQRDAIRRALAAAVEI